MEIGINIPVWLQRESSAQGFEEAVNTNLLHALRIFDWSTQKLTSVTSGSIFQIMSQGNVAFALPNEIHVICLKDESCQDEQLDL